jgi:cobalt/nickel transport system permease protein
MHITEGVAPAHIAVIGWLLAVMGVVKGLGKLRDEQVPKAALLAAVIFVSSLVIRLPIGPTSVHPILNGLAGLILGWIALPVFMVSLFLQALIFQFGGITTLGINTITMGLPAVACYYLFNSRLRNLRERKKSFLYGTLSGVTALLLSYILWAAALLLCGRQLAAIAALSLGPHILITIIEGLFTGFVVAFLFRVYPRVFQVQQPVKDVRQK